MITEKRSTPPRWPFLVAAVACATLSTYEFSLYATVGGAYDWSIRLAVLTAILGCIAVWPEIAGSARDLSLKAWAKGLPPRPESAAKRDESLWSIMAFCRFLFAMIVLNYHVWQIWPMPGWLGWFHNISPFAAVVGFFVISGIAMNHSYNSQPKGFYGRRVRRIYPLSVTCFILGCIPFLVWGGTLHGPIYTDPGGHVVHLFYRAPHEWQTYVGNLFLLNGFVVDRMATVGATWSLSIEFCFYWLTPVFNRLPTWALLCLVAASGYVHWFHADYGINFINPLNGGWGAIIMAWSWLLGFVYWRHRDEKWSPILLLTFGVAMLERWDQNGAKFPAIAYIIGCACIIAAPQLSATVRKVFNYLGDLSYPIYLIAAPFWILIEANGRFHWPWWVHWFGCILAAMVAHHLIEKPFARFYKRLTASRRERSAIAPSPVSA